MNLKLIGKADPHAPTQLTVRNPGGRPASRHDCKHLSIRIDARHREVFCMQCERQLDAVQVLIEYADADRARDLRNAREDESRFKQRAERIRSASGGGYKGAWKAAEEDAAGMRQVAAEAIGYLQKSRPAEAMMLWNRTIALFAGKCAHCGGTGKAPRHMRGTHQSPECQSCKGTGEPADPKPIPQFLLDLREKMRGDT